MIQVVFFLGSKLASNESWKKFDSPVLRWKRKLSASREHPYFILFLLSILLFLSFFFILSVHPFCSSVLFILSVHSFLSFFLFILSVHPFCSSFLFILSVHPFYSSFLFFLFILSFILSFSFFLFHLRYSVLTICSSFFHPLCSFFPFILSF